MHVPRLALLLTPLVLALGACSDVAPGAVEPKPPAPAPGGAASADFRSS